MPRWLVMVNPAAGRRPVDPTRVRHALDSVSLDADMVVPLTREEAFWVVEEGARSGVTHFAVVGGDGTINLAINALLGLDLGFSPVIGVLPGGSGCDLIRTFGIPKEMGAAARHLTGEQTYPVDVAALQGDWGTRYFVNVAQAGVGAAAAQTAPRMSRRLGVVRYPIAFGIRLPRFPRARVKVTTERRTIESEALAVILANAQFFAGGWNVAPRATLVDGILDIQVIDVTKARTPAIVPKVVRGTHLADPSVHRLTAAEFVLETDPVWPVECDGDLVGNTRIRGRVVPAAISLKI